MDSMDIAKVGLQIAELRKNKGLTQNDLGERLGVSFQAVSKWERGETLPDTTILPDLANVLGTTIDCILNGGDKRVEFKGKINVSDMINGIKSLKNMGECLGKDNLIYRNAIKGINENMNTDIESAFIDDYAFEAFVAEAIIQNLISVAYVDVTEVKNNFKHENFKNVVLNYCERYGIK